MASFAPGTPQAYVNNYYRTMPRWLGGQVPDNQHAYGVPNTGRQPSFFYSQPGRAQPQQSPWATSTPYGPQQGQPFGAYSQQQQAPQQRQPPPFQAQTFNFDGTQSQMPNFQQRDAFISQINSQLGQMQGQSWNQPMGAPQFNFPQMWGQAGDMVQGGWQNPYAQQPASQPGQRAPTTRPAPPQGSGYRSSMPAGTPPSLAPFFEQARQMDPTADQFQQRELAYQLRNNQAAQARRGRHAAQDQANADWTARQQRYNDEQTAREERNASANARRRQNARDLARDRSGWGRKRVSGERMMANGVMQPIDPSYEARMAAQGYVF